MRPGPALLLVVLTLLATAGKAEEMRLDDAQLGKITVENEAAEALVEESGRDCFGRGDSIGALTDCYPANLPSLADRDPLIGYRAILKAIDELPPNDR